MPTLNLGRVRFNPRGEYAPDTTYGILDVVSFNGASYFCKLPISNTDNIAPGSSEVYWQLLIQGVDLTTMPIDTYTGDGQTVIEALNRRRSVFRPEAFMAFGATDYADAIELMLTVANGRQCIFENEKSYNIDRIISYQGDVNITCEGHSEIFLDGQTSPIVDFYGSTHNITELNQQIEINGRDWSVVDATDVVPGMLMQIKSSVSWYHDPRPESTDARKSELHKVVAVTGTTITTELPANDGYDTSTETVEVTFFNPIKVKIENIKVRGTRDAPAETTARCTGWRITNALDSLILNAGSKDAAASGCALIKSYNSHVVKGNYDGANDFFTGYGIQTSGCTLCWAVDTKHWECRRGVDVSGADIISLHTLVRNCTQTGGGYDSKGLIYGWDGAGGLGSRNFGFGTHGAADKTIFQDNIVERCHTPFNTRGRNTKFLNNKIYGRTRSGAFSLSFGTNCIIEGTWCDPSFFAGKSTTTLGGANINSRICDIFVNVGSTWQSSYDNPVVIQNNTLMCQEAVVSLSASVARLVYKNNTVTIKTLSSETLAYLFVNETGVDMNTADWDIDVGSVYKQGSGAWKLFDPIMNAGGDTIINGDRGTFTPTINTLFGVDPLTPVHDLKYEVNNGVVRVYGRIGLKGKVDIAPGDNITAVVGNNPYPRNFVTSLSAQGTVGSNKMIGSMAARTTSNPGDMFLAGLNYSAAPGDEFTICVDYSYRFSDASPA